MNIIALIIKKIVIILITFILILAAIFFLILKGDRNKLYNQLPSVVQELAFVKKIQRTTILTSSSVEEVQKFQQYLADLKNGTDINTNFFQSNVFKSLQNLQKPPAEHLITDNKDEENFIFTGTPSTSSLPKLQFGRDNPFKFVDD